MKKDPLASPETRCRLFSDRLVVPVRFVRRSIILVLALLCVALPLFAQLPSGRIDEAIADLNEQKFPDAEAILKDVLRDHPHDPTVLGLMAVALDGEKRYAEAETYYSQAVKLSPGSAALFNNLGTHYLAMGDREHARQAYLSAVRINPHDPNANLQLAQIAVKTRQGAEALRYLDRLPAETQAKPALSVVRAQALALAGKPELAESLLARALAESPDDPRVAFAAGMTFADWKRYQDAEKAFTQALRSAPTDFDAQYNLGLAALGAKDSDRAANAFQIVLRQRPDDPDCLYNLARAYDAQGQTLGAMVPLEQAQRLAPQRADIILLAANLSEKLGFYGDAAVAFGSYLKFRPGDNPARRERGFALAVASRTEDALRDLEEYVHRNPRDTRGLYELGVVETIWNREKSLGHIKAALAIDPTFLPARYARAVLYYQAGQYKEAISDLQTVLAREPDDLGALDTLGETELQLGNAQASVKALSHAAELAPDDRLILMHYSRALARNHQPQEAQAVLDKLRRLGSESNPGRPNSGLLRFLELSPSQQEAQYLANLQVRLRMNPDSVPLKVRIAKEELAQGERQQALEMFHQVLVESSDPRVLQDCAGALLDNQEYEPARGLLEKVLSIEPSRTDALLDLAIAVFRTTGAEAALAELSRVPLNRQKGDFFLLQAQLLDAEDKPEQAAAALNRGLEASPTRADLYFQAALFLVKHHQVRQMVDVLGRAEKIVPGDPKLMLTRAIGLEMLHEREVAMNVLSKLESQDPTWYLPYEIHGIIQSIRIRPAEAKPLLQTAIALGADDPRAYFYLASATIQANTEDTAEAQKAIERALALDPKDPFIQSLAGRIAYLKKDYPAALERLRSALAIWPDMIEAHQTLSGTYRALGDKEKAAEELKTVLRIKQQNPTADQELPFSVGDMLFSVGTPTATHE
jgi:tetratricopeptide (TPR) repeat protein